MPTVIARLLLRTISSNPLQDQATARPDHHIILPGRMGPYAAAAEFNILSPELPEGRLGRNLLRGLLGDKVNALMAAIGYNLRLILKALSCWLQILKELFGPLAGLTSRV